MLKDLPAKMSRLKVIGEFLCEEERELIIQDLYQNMDDEVDFECFLKVSGNSFYILTRTVLPQNYYSLFSVSMVCKLAYFAI